MSEKFGDCKSCGGERKEKCPFKHFPRGGEDEPWRTRIFHKIAKFQYICGITIAGIVAEGIGFFLLVTETNTFEQLYTKYAYVFWGIVLAALLVLGMFVVILMQIEHYAFQRWELSDIMHRFSHELRDMNVNFNTIHKEHFGDDHAHDECGWTLLESYCNRFADYIERYFSLLAKNLWPFYEKGDIRCVIRLIVTKEDRTKYLITAGRSRAYNLSSKKISTPLSADFGIFSLLKHKAHQGVIVCNDVAKAILMRYYSESLDSLRNDNKIQSFMIVPINGYVKKGVGDNETGEMINIGTITVDTYRKNEIFKIFGRVWRKEIFKRSHVDSFRAFADLLGAMLPYNLNLIFAGDSNCILPEIVLDKIQNAKSDD